MALPEAERRLLGEALLESSGEPWRDEIVRRIEQLRAGEVELEPWSEVRRRIRDARGE